jgi:predicted AlkP superfamily pyrophosphatase or phosphodiesterase
VTLAAPRSRRLAAFSVGLVLATTLAVSPTRADDVLPAGEPATARGRTIGSNQVLAISLDGFNVNVLRKIGRAGAPNLFRLFRTGASTKNARAQIEMTVTLPNHTSQVTGRPIETRNDGHGVTWNTNLRRRTIQRDGAGNIESIFTRVHDAGRGTALFATERKFSLWRRSWSDSVDRTKIVQDGDHAVTLAARRELVRRNRAFTFLHLGAMDEAGHAHGWMSRPYRRAAKRVDRQLGILLRAIRNHRRLRDLTIVLTADHGGRAGSKTHSDRDDYFNYRIPFVIWGDGVDRGNLYAMNPTYADPGRRRPHSFTGTQPIRNGDLANVAAHLLGLSSVPGSLWGADQSLTWHH